MKTLNRFNSAILIASILVLLAGLWAGLLRIGWAWPPIQPALPVGHGPLMVSGFFGALIGLERAVALKERRWVYLAPVLSGLGGLALTFGIAGVWGALLLFLGSAGMVAIFVVILRQQTLPYTVMMAAGAVTLMVGNLLWLLGWPVSRFVLWWMGFLVLTIVGERLELSRIVSRSRFSEVALLVASAVFALGLLTALAAWVPGVRIASAGLLLLAAWLLRYDIARRTVRKPGLTRFIAICLLGGYVWMGLGGLIGLVYPVAPAGPVYDAVLHAIFLGFTFTMIFGHAPIIFPAVLGLRIAYRKTMYIPLVSLHLSLALRVTGDLLANAAMRRWGGLLAMVVILGYFWMIAPFRKVNRTSAPLIPGM